MRVWLDRWVRYYAPGLFAVYFLTGFVFDDFNQLYLWLGLYGCVTLTVGIIAGIHEASHTGEVDGTFELDTTNPDRDRVNILIKPPLEDVAKMESFTLKVIRK